MISTIAIEFLQRFDDILFSSKFSSSGFFPKIFLDFPNFHKIFDFNTKFDFSLLCVLCRTFSSLRTCGTSPWALIHFVVRILRPHWWNRKWQSSSSQWNAWRTQRSLHLTGISTFLYLFRGWVRFGAPIVTSYWWKSSWF